MDRGFTGETPEYVEIIEIVPRLIGLHRDAADRAMADGWPAGRRH